MTREEAIKVAYGIPVTKAQHEALQFLIPELRESEDEKIRKQLIKLVKSHLVNHERCMAEAYLEKYKDASKAIEAVNRIDKYIDEHLANAHDMKDSNPDKKYYRGWDDALGKMAGILQDVYSGEKQKEPENVSASTMAPSCWAEEPSLQKEEDKCPEYCVRSHCIGCSIYEKRKKDDEMVRKIITDSVFYQYGAGAEYKAVLDYLDRLEKWNGLSLRDYIDDFPYIDFPYIKRMEQESVSPMSYGSLDEAMQEAGRRFDLPCTDKDKYSVADVFYAGVRAERESKQEWSEEECGRLFDIEHYLDGTLQLSPDRKIACIDFLKSLRPQPKQKRQIKEGDKVSIHCRKGRKEDIITFYDGKVGEVIHVYNAKKHPWGHIIVRLDNGCNDGFYEDELEVLDEPSWKPSEVCYGAKGDPDPAGVWKPSKEQMEELYNAFYTHSVGAKSCDVLESLYNQLKKL